MIFSTTHYILPNCNNPIHNRFTVFCFVLRTQCMKSNETKWRTWPMNIHNFHVLWPNLVRQEGSLETPDKDVLVTFFKNQCWFLLSNIRTYGISKGHFGEKFSLQKPTNFIKKSKWVTIWPFHFGGTVRLAPRNVVLNSFFQLHGATLILQRNNTITFVQKLQHFAVVSIFIGC